MELLIVKFITLVGASFGLGYGSKKIRLWFHDKLKDAKDFIGDVKEARKNNDAPSK